MVVELENQFMSVAPIRRRVAYYAILDAKMDTMVLVRSVGHIVIVAIMMMGYFAEYPYTSMAKDAAVRYFRKNVAIIVRRTCMMMVALAEGLSRSWQKKAMVEDGESQWFVLKLSRNKLLFAINHARIVSTELDLCVGLVVLTRGPIVEWVAGKTRDNAQIRSSKWLQRPPRLL